MFDENAQKEALEMTFNAVKSLLSEKATTYLSEAFVDLDNYIKFKIEAEINKNKGTVSKPFPFFYSISLSEEDSLVSSVPIISLDSELLAKFSSQGLLSIS